MKKNLNIFITTTTAVLFSLAMSVQFFKSLHWGYGSWRMTDWLINYSGGFVRRGLSGEFVYWLAANTGVQANYVVILISYSAFLAILAFFLVRARGHFPVYLIISPVLLGSAAYQNFIVSKDVLGILSLIACLIVYERKCIEYKRLIFINLVAIIAILCHETFFFFGLPILVLLSVNPASDRFSAEAKGVLVASVKFSPAIAAFLLTVIFHGNSATAITINESWQQLWMQIEPGSCCFATPSASINALQWSAAQGMSASARVLHEFSKGVYAPLAWLLTICFCFWCLVNFLGRTSDKVQEEDLSASRKIRFATILIFQFLVIFPLLFLGWDFGRWIFLWTTSSLAI
jgi:hypothetical protein